MAGVYFQYGCGLSCPAGWQNFDASPTLRLQRIPVLGSAVGLVKKVPFPPGVRYGDILKGLPIAKGSADGAYCSHVLEHLSFDDCVLALRNTFALLKPGGRFRLVMPDLRRVADEYHASQSPDAAHKFMTETLLGQKTRVFGVMGLMHSWIGNFEHRWLWDYPAIEMELAKVGFTRIRRARFNDSVDPRFTEVEEESRWSGHLGAECVKP